jgi:uncharacterized GH25 family protein
LIWLAAPVAPPVHAHDFWIEPTRFRPAIGSEVPLPVRVGQEFKGEPVIYLPDLFERYVYVGSRGEKPVPGVPGDDHGRIPAVDAGLTVVGYRSIRDRVTFDTPEEFAAYLEKEGMERIGASGKRPADRRPVSEIYSRAAKSLIHAGPVGNGPVDRPLGFRMELIAERNPYALRPGDSLPLRLVYERRPLEAALVVAYTKDRPLDKFRARTDKQGRVNLPLDRPGIWLVTSVHMVPARSGSNADWESTWASLTFEIAIK